MVRISGEKAALHTESAWMDDNRCDIATRERSSEDVGAKGGAEARHVQSSTARWDTTCPWDKCFYKRVYMR